jgi:uncharacterized protein (TIGR00725 family)
MKKIIIGVMGPGDEATAEEIQLAEKLGFLLAQAGWVTLSGGRNAGVMDAVNRGAQKGGGLTVGILPTTEASKTSVHVDLAIVTDMGSARNNINVLSSDVVIACGMGRGTAAEVALALKAGKHVILLACSDNAHAFFKEIGDELLTLVKSPQEAIESCRVLLASKGRS